MSERDSELARWYKAVRDNAYEAFAEALPDPSRLDPSRGPNNATWVAFLLALSAFHAIALLFLVGAL